VVLEPRAAREARYDAIAKQFAERYRGLDTHVHLRSIFRLLKQDLADAGGDLNADSRHAWPPDGDGDAAPAELSIGNQFAILHDRAAELAAVRNVISAEVLRRQICNLLADAHRSTAGFTAPPTVTPPPRTVTPPWPIFLAIKRLTADGALPITEDTLAKHDAIGEDARMVSFWLSQLDG
jgi:transposase